MNTSFRFLTQFTQSPEGKLWDGEGDGGSAPAAPGSATSTPATPSAPALGGQPASPVATSQATPAQATSVPDGFVPRYRIDETRQAAQRQAAQEYAQREAAWKAEIEQVKGQLHALVGITPKGDPQVEGIKAQFGNIFPGLSKLEEKAAMLDQLLERSGDFESQSNHYWTSYGRNAMDRLFNHATESIGAPLTDEGKRTLHSAFVGYVQSSPERVQRYSEDPSIVQDFWKEFSSSLIDPVRRTAAAATATRAGASAALPQDTPGGVPRTSPAPTFKSMDERADAAWAQYQTIKK